MDGTTRAHPQARHHTRSPIPEVAERVRAPGEPPAGRTAPSPGIDAAPHVRAAVHTACGGAPALSAAVLAALDPEHRRGWRALPEPLPAVPALVTYARRSLPRDADPDHVLAIALCASGPLAALCLLTGTPADRIAASPLGGLIRVHGGTFRIADPALGTAVLAASAVSDRARAHHLLAAAFAEAGDADAALWHRARGSVAGDARLVEPLLVQAGDAARAGAASRAWARAVEAVEHAPSGTDAHAHALLSAGRAALSAGWVFDALEHIEHALRVGGDHRGEATAAFVLAHTLRQGVVPAPDALIPADATGPGYRCAAVLGASLSAERRDHERTAAWLATGGRLAHVADERAALQAWCDVLAGEDARAGAGDEVDGDGIRRVAQALRSGLDGDPDAGVRALAEPDAGDLPDAVLGLSARGPVFRARKAVTAVLLHVWAGRIGIARKMLRSAAAELPVALPFAGLAVTLSRRLDLAVDGRIGQCSRDLADAVPWAREPAAYVDRAIDAYLQGRSDEAAVHMGLWCDQGCPSESLGLPGLDEIGPLGAPSSPEPPEATAARALRERVRAVREASWRTDLDTVAEESRGIRSPFERARVEALLGSTCAARGDRGGGIRHLRAAQSLFEEAGARAWRRMVDRRLRIMAEPRAGTGEAGAPGSAPLASLQVCRATWEPILTARELEVALLMAEGRTNREIAQGLHVSVRTVEVHGGRIFSKLDVRTRQELTVLAHRTDQHL